jgi:hypothetical protein
MNIRRQNNYYCKFIVNKSDKNRLDKRGGKIRKYHCISLFCAKGKTP